VSALDRRRRIAVALVALIGACEGTVELFVESTAGVDATISWQVTIDLPVPRAELAVGQLQLEVVHDP
jgi:hypothetical protein